MGFIAIWFVWNLSVNLPDFLQGHLTLGLLLHFYGTQIPNVIVQSIPVGELLALLYAMTQMSRSNEIISMLCAGRSLERILLPFFCVGLLLVVLSTYLNYQQAPQAEAIKNQLMEEIKNGKKNRTIIGNHLFRNRADHRTWYLQSLDVAHQSAHEVQIIQQNEQGDLLEEWYALDAHFDPATHAWRLEQMHHVTIDPRGGNILTFDASPHFEITNWSESPWRIASSTMNPDYLSVPELRDYLKNNSDFTKPRLAPFKTHLDYRWALPWTCFIVILLAAPCSLIYSRRSILSGVALAVGFFVALLFSSNLFLALGKGYRSPAWVAAWGPMILFAAIGVFLLRRKSSGRDLW